MKCPVCGSPIQMKDSQTGECENCGMKFSLEALRELGSKPQEDTCASDPLDAPSQQECVGAITVPEVTPLSDQEDQKDSPLAFQWETSVSFSVLGIVCSLLLNSTLLVGIAGLICTIVYLVAVFVYLCLIYPSYFGERPKLTSSSSISFCNFFFGGVIFGALFNTNLTKGRKGISYIVNIVVLSLSLIALIISIFISLDFPLDKVKNPMYKESGMVVLYPDRARGQWAKEGYVLEGSNQSYLAYAYNSKGHFEMALQEMGLNQEEIEDVFNSLSHATEANDKFQDELYDLAYEASLSSKPQIIPASIGTLDPERQRKAVEEYQKQMKGHLAKNPTSHTVVQTTTFSIRGHDYVLNRYVGMQHLDHIPNSLGSSVCVARYSVVVIQEL